MWIDYGVGINAEFQERHSYVITDGGRVRVDPAY